jgi:DNA-binding transcriptional LysR family regulator
MAALTAFEAAARHESFTLAARELSLTESAVSRQIKVLEKSLDVSLFDRVKHRVALTRAGRLYSEQVRASLHALERDTLSIAAYRGGQGSLELAVQPTLALEWLIPRLPAFYARHPGIRINMGVRLDTFSFRDEHFEAAIHYGQPNWPHAISDLLFGERMVPIARRDLIGDSIRKPSDVLKFPLLHPTDKQESWKQWFEAAGIPDTVAPANSGTFEVHSMLVRAAESGLGIALAPDVFVTESTWHRGVVRAYDLSIPREDSHYLVYPKHLRDSYPFESFREWLLQEARVFAKRMERQSLRESASARNGARKKRVAPARR